MNLKVRNIAFWIIVLFSISSFQAQDTATNGTGIAFMHELNLEQQYENLIKLAEKEKNFTPKSALKYVDKAIEVAEELEDENKILAAKVFKAEILFYDSKYNEAIELATKCIEKAKELDDKKQLALALRIKGIVNNELGDYEQSTVLFFKALRIFESLEDKEGIAKLLSDIGTVNFLQRDLDSAIKYFYRSLDVAQENDDTKGLARAYINIAAVYQEQKKYKEAIEYFKKCKDLNAKIGNHLLGAVNELNIGLNFMMTGELDKGYEYMKKALDVFKSMDNKVFLSRTYLHIATYFKEKENYDSSLVYAQKSLDIANESDVKRMKFYAAYMINDLYLLKGDKEKAYDYLALANVAKDSLDILENKAKFAKLELQYETDKYYSQERIKQQRKNILFLVIVIFFLISSLVFAFVFLRQRMRAKAIELEKQKLEMDLEYKNKKLTTNVMSLMKKNEMLEKISEKLLSIKKSAVKDETKIAINKVSKEIKKITDEEIYEEFQKRFNEVHKGFYDRLLKKYPNLSPNEQRLCAFLKLNMSTKEISNLTGQRESTLETARYRLRKKLGLSNSKVNLVTFISKI